MEADFWRGRWRDNQLGWHRASVNPMLVRRLDALGLASGARLFLPLCGKTRDIGWLLDRGFRVVGAELVESAVEQLFSELGVEPEIREAGPARVYSARGIDVFVGDLFDLSPDLVGAIDGVYDRAALVALPAATRPRYAAQLAGLAGGAPQLLITYVYDQTVINGPPFSVSDEEVRRLYAGSYDVALLESADVEGGLKGVCPATERMWLLERR